MRYLFMASLMAIELACAEATPQKSEEITATIARLGAEDFETREAASRELAAMGEAALAPLKEAREASEDAEIRNRIGAIRRMIWRKLPDKALKLGLNAPEHPWVLAGGSLSCRTKPHLWIQNISDEPLTVCIPQVARGAVQFELQNNEGKVLGLLELSSRLSLARWLTPKDFVRLEPGEKADAFPRLGWEWSRARKTGADNNGWLSLEEGSYRVLARFDASALVIGAGKVEGSAQALYPVLSAEPIHVQTVLEKAARPASKSE